ncbi:MAG: hypothetical protein K6U74_07390, partial [Firmicutes bacterium]|nr:hypothetical protein [Bacillota bacterium]
MNNFGKGRFFEKKSVYYRNLQNETIQAFHDEFIIDDDAKYILLERLLSLFEMTFSVKVSEKIYVVNQNSSKIHYENVNRDIIKIKDTKNLIDEINDDLLANQDDTEGYRNILLNNLYISWVHAKNTNVDNE